MIQLSDSVLYICTCVFVSKTELCDFVQQLIGGCFGTKWDKVIEVCPTARVHILLFTPQL